MTISEFPTNINYNSSGTKFIYNNNKYHIPLIGFHQARNASLAIDVVNTLYPNVKNRTIKKALKKYFWPEDCIELSTIYFMTFLIIKMDWKKH